MVPTLAKEKSDFPTILVVYEMSAALVEALRVEGYFVLEASDRMEAISITRMHSRPIHLLLIGPSSNSRSLAGLLQQYRPKMNVLVVGEDHTDLDPPSVLEKVRQLFK
jgi:hypothetical protein